MVGLLLLSGCFGSSGSSIQDEFHPGIRGALLSIPSTPISAYLTSSSDFTLTVTNQGNWIATDFTATTVSTPFTYKGGTYPGTGGTCGTSLNIGESCTLILTFTPAATGTVSKTLRLYYNDGFAQKVLAFSMSALGIINKATLSIAGGNFGSRCIDTTTTTTLTVTNTTERAGALATGISAATLSSPYSYKGGTYPGTGGTCGATLALNASCTLVVNYSPTAAGNSTQDLSLTYNNNSETDSATVNLLGACYRSGCFDVTFNTVGFSTINTGGANAVLIQTDGKTVAAGDDSNSAFLIARYNTDGSFDTSFHTNGKNLSTLADGYISDLILQTDGKLIAVGRADTCWGLVRYETDGNLDTSFYTEGKVVTCVGVGASEFIHSGILQTDGKILVQGKAWNDDMSDYSMGVARYHVDGSIDTSFYTTGVVLTTVDNGTYDSLTGLVFQTDAKIILAGNFDSFLVLKRYASNGSTDTSFGGGQIDVSFGGSNGFYDLVLQSDGKFVVGGYRNPNRALIARIHANGQVDTAFGSNGSVATSLGTLGSGFNSLTLQTDGGILAGGTATSSTRSSFALVRYGSSGILDTAFLNSIATSTISTSATAYHSIRAVKIQADGGIIAAGTIFGAGTAFAVMRYLP